MVEEVHKYRLGSRRTRFSKRTVDKLWANSNCVGTTSVLSRRAYPLVNKKDQSRVVYVDDFDQSKFIND